MAFTQTVDVKPLIIQQYLLSAVVHVKIISIAFAAASWIRSHKVYAKNFLLRKNVWEGAIVTS